MNNHDDCVSDLVEELPSALIDLHTAELKTEHGISNLMANIEGSSNKATVTGEGRIRISSFSKTVFGKGRKNLKFDIQVFGKLLDFSPIKKSINEQ